MQNSSLTTPNRHKRRLFTRVALVALGLPVALLVLLVLLQVELDLSRSKDTVADLAGWMVGREVQIDGEVRLALGSEPALTLSGLRVGEMAGDNVTALGAGRLSLKANLGALLGGRLKSVELVLEGGQATVRVGGERDLRSSLGNWLRFASALADQQFVPDRVDLEIQDTRIAFVGDREGARSNLQLVSGKVMRTTLEAPFELQLSGTWDERPLNASGNTQPLAETGERGLHLASFAVQFLGVDAKVDGKVGRTQAGELQADLELDAQANDLSAWRGLLGVVSLPVKRAKIKARFKSDAGLLALENIDASLDRTRFAGSLSLHPNGQRPAIKGELQVSDLKTAEWHSAFRTRDVEAGVGSDPFDQLAALQVPGPFDAKISIKGSNIELRTGAMRNAVLDLRLDEGTAKLSLVELPAAKDKFRLLLEKTRGERGFDYRFALRDPKIDLALLAAGSEVEGMIEGEIAANIELHSAGNTAAEIRSVLQGEIELLMGAGKADVTALDKLVGGLTHAVGEIFTDESTLATVNCSTLDAGLKDGLLTIKLGLIDTRYSTVLVSGSVDLRKDELDLDVIPRKKAVSLSVAPEVRLTGSLQQPTITIKKGSLLLELGGLITNLVYPPSMLAGVFDEVAGENPCVSMLIGEKPPPTEKVEEPVAD